jgi:adenylosuccinate lyase
MNQTNSELYAISPVDGRYKRLTSNLNSYFSEFGLIKYRVQIEVEYFIALCKLPLPQLANFNLKEFEANLRAIYTQFSESDALRIKEIEKTTNHDVKAVEYFLKEAFAKLKIENAAEFIHFGLTSQDINNTAIPLSLKEATSNEILPLLEQVYLKMQQQANEWSTIPMLAKTHGQPASPTLLGKEWRVFTERLQIQLNSLKQVPFSAKFGGATGNFNAHYVAYPTIDWVKFANQFVNETLTLDRSQTTTQIEHYDNLAAFCHANIRINTILLDFCKDVWQYVSMEYFKQQLKAGEIGSSAMPHKVNPIDFENAEGNLGIANALFTHLAEKLPISRLQRDLTDSTVLRNLGMPLAHQVIALQSILKGLNKLLLNETKLHHDLEQNWAVVAEAIQTILRREAYEKPYEALKALTRTNQHIDQEQIQNFIHTLQVSDEVKSELLKITPHNYTGI